MDVLLRHQHVGSLHCAKARLGTAQRQGRGHAVRVRAAEDNQRSDNAISALDSLLGSTSDAESSRDPNLVEWWRIRPRQAAPPRTTSLSSGASSGGRFIANEEMLRNEVWAGRKTLEGQALELPKVTPYVSYGIALVNAAVYGTAVRVAAAQGPEAAGELLAAVGLSGAGVLEQGEAWRLLTGCVVQPDLASLAVVLYGMLAVAPRVEASLGYRTFICAYALSAVVAADVALALGGAGGGVDGAASAAAAASSAAAAGPSPLLDAVLHPAAAAAADGVSSLGVGIAGLGAVMGMAGCAVAHQIVNGAVERRASSAAASSASASASGGSASSGGSGGAGVEPRGVLLAAGGAALALQAALAGGAGGGGGGGGVAAAAVLAASLGAGFGTGFLLSLAAGPRYQVTRQAELPDGSMWIPDPDAVQEVTVVLDRTPSIQRSLATGGVAGVVGLGTAALLALQ